MSYTYLEIINGKICPYCECESKLVKGENVYPHKINETPRPYYLDKMFYQCINNPNHYVGTYKDNETSLGRIADTDLRRWKNKGHRAFDPLWKDKIHFKNQQEAYQWLSDKMELPIEHTHFGMFTIDQCQKAIKFCEEMINESKS